MFDANNLKPTKTPWPSRYTIPYDWKEAEIAIELYSDASFADDKATRASTAGFVIFLAGGPIAWKSKR
ncbi:hypothetical protein L249_6433 [Ophiocordyceps polyrhachis-furcata BCC 54312]|uniref:Uncharacterized protein n=1 Tax=Ophiocordyceps polyrhachis-furcata BCC 54312 TaxID=1330021 RepID=A0A367LJS0_9HYPO|nr:hypothetical protein L249_6433 [Ophiocordyceps polyrhachis-furcata BCC 54312]